MRSIIVGTAGHIDHGKSALVRALTGTDPDRLPEEKRRGITIDLGFADLVLDDFRLGFVDVPGHEKFVKNMLAGAHGIDLLALVVAADEGVMPQTREHFDICRLLGVREGLVVITKRDLVDDEMLLLVEDEVRELVADSFLSSAPIIAISARTGQGMDDLKAALKETARRVTPRSTESTARLPVDRAFSMKGFGAVVTGTLVSGEIGEGDELELLPQRLSVRVRGTQVHGKAVSRAVAGQRTAVNLGGIEVSQIERGMVLAPAGQLRSTQIIDAYLEVLPSASRAVRTRARIRVHIGAAEVLGRVRVLDETGEVSPGSSGFVQLRLESPVAAVHGDRFIVRTYSPAETIAGGIVLDPFAAKHRGKQLEVVRKNLLTLMSEDPVAKVTTFVSLGAERGLRHADLVAATGWTAKVVSELISEGKAAGDIVELGRILLARGNYEKICERIIKELEQHHKREPLSRGMLRETLRERSLGRPSSELFSALVSGLEKKDLVVSEKDTVRVRDHRVDLSARDQKLREALEQTFLKAGVEAPSLDEAMTRAGLGPSESAHGRRILQLLLDQHRLVRVQPDMIMHVKVIEDLKVKLLAYGSRHEPERLIDVPAFKELAGVSRKYAIPLLEYFDRERITRRAGDKRLILKA